MAAQKKQAEKREPSVTVDGQRYELPTKFTFREMNLIKRITGLRAGDLFKALLDGDSDVAFAYAAIAQIRERGWAAFDEQKLFDMPIADVEIDFGNAGDEEEDEQPVPPEESVAAPAAAADGADS